ncbi:PREDICTED: uncharacterized protein LOC105556232 [Vollenhovia emeryi]|uniref:uncharacterized protein LOC105556232 n=1 Tax=Vollenhovia emeryi TaxID=411798 RepID=UPI0005F4B570|nr:PREDICTED: uncharacterized protein LOC105556232 [Vollenhovia emeryi]
MGKTKKRSREKDSEEKILKKLRKLEEKLGRRRIAFEEGPEEPVLQKENRPDNLSVPSTSSDITKDHTNVPALGELSQIPDPEIAEIYSGILEGKSEVSDTVVGTKQLDEETKKVLGIDPENAKQKEIDLHPDLVSRWAKWIKEGLPKETKTEVLDKYDRKGTLSLDAPTLNAEIAATLNEAGTKRDNLFIQEQNLAGTALASLGEAISMILKDEEDPIDRLKLLERLADTGKLIAHLYFQISSARKAFIAPILTKQVKDLLQKTTPGEFLYGDKLGEVLGAPFKLERPFLEIGNSESGLQVTEVLEEPTTKQGETNPASQGSIHATGETINSENVLDASSGESPFPGCRNLMRIAYRKKSLPEEAIDILVSSLTASTLRQYDSGLKNWWNFCRELKLDPLQAETNAVLQFLSQRFIKGASYGTLNTERAAISLISTNDSVNNPVMTRFFKGIFKLRPTKPKYDSIWDSEVALKWAENTRHAATSTADAKGLDVNIIRKTASWSEQSKMFARFYKRPILTDHANFVAVVLGDD